MLDLIQQFGLAVLGGVFVWAGTEHFLKFGAVAAQLDERRFPAPKPMLAAGSALEIVAGLALATGIARPYAAAALIVFTLAASVLALDFWRYSGAERQNIRNAFTINIAVVGGLILAGVSDLQ